MKRILIVQGGGRPNGNTAQLVDSFIKGAEETGHLVERISLLKILVLIGEKKAVSYAIKNETTAARNTKLAKRLMTDSAESRIVETSILKQWIGGGKCRSINCSL